MKKIYAIALITALLLSLFLPGCSTDKPNDNKVVIYSEYNGALGTEDEIVEKAIEEKFFADTGLQIDLQIEAVGTDMVGQKIVTAMADSSAQIDGFITHYGSDSPINSYILDGLTMDLTELVKTHAPSYYASFNAQTDPTNSIYNSGSLEGKLYALSNKVRNSGWVMLVRRDYMEQTSFNPDDYNILNEGYKNMSVEDFKQMVVEMKSNTDAQRPVVGRPWSLDYFFTSPFGAVDYGQQILDKDGNLIPAYADESYLQVLELYRWMQEEKLWTENPGNAQNLLNDFISGKGAVYFDWPEVTSQIDVARDLKEATGVDCVFIAPLLREGSDTETNGNARIQGAFSGLAIPIKSKNCELLLKYIDWLYSDVKNYELAQYGIEGQHWVRVLGEDGQEYWDYPADKKEQYDRAAPYSGKFCLISDYHISELLNADYTQDEREIIDIVLGFPVYPAEGHITEGMILPGVPATDRKLRNIANAHFDEYVSVRAYAWSDAALPEGQTIRSMWEQMVEHLYGDYFAYVEYNTENYNRLIGG